MDNQPKILRGAFVEYGLSIPPLFVVFQFNPDEINRQRSLSYNAPGSSAQSSEEINGDNGLGCGQDRLRRFHEEKDDLEEIRKEQQIAIEEETIDLDIRLDATEKLNKGDPIAKTFGIAPELSTLELFTYPKGGGMLSQALSQLPFLGEKAKGYLTKREENPPMVLFIWGYSRVLPVNITSMSIKETAFNTLLNPTRAVVSVGLKVIAGQNPPYLYSKTLKETESLLNLANIADIADVVIPG